MLEAEFVARRSVLTSPIHQVEQFFIHLARAPLVSLCHVRAGKPRDAQINHLAQLRSDGGLQISQTYLAGQLGIEMTDQKRPAGKIAYPAVPLIFLNQLFKFTEGTNWSI